MTHVNGCGQTSAGCEQFSLLEAMLRDLAGGRRKEEGEGARVSLANQIHLLVDAAPVKSEG